MSTQQDYLVSATVSGAFGTRDLGVFDGLSGGDAQITEARHRPGGLKAEKQYRTLPSYQTVTIMRVYEPDRDAEIIRFLKAQAGALQMTVVEQPLDDAGNAWGKPTVYKGRLGTVKAGASDSNSQTIRMYEIDCNTETVS